MGVGAWREGRVEFHQIEERLFPERIALVKGMAGTMVQGDNGLVKWQEQMNVQIYRGACVLCKYLWTCELWECLYVYMCKTLVFEAGGRCFKLCCSKVNDKKDGFYIRNGKEVNQVALIPPHPHLTTPINHLFTHLSNWMTGILGDTSYSFILVFTTTIKLCCF